MEEDLEEEMEETGPDLDQGNITRIKKKSSQRRPSTVTYIKWDQQGMQANVSLYANSLLIEIMS